MRIAFFCCLHQDQQHLHVNQAVRDEAHHQHHVTHLNQSNNAIDPRDEAVGGLAASTAAILHVAPIMMHHSVVLYAPEGSAENTALQYDPMQQDTSAHYCTDASKHDSLRMLPNSN